MSTPEKNLDIALIYEVTGIRYKYFRSCIQVRNNVVEQVGILIPSSIEPLPSLLNSFNSLPKESQSAAIVLITSNIHQNNLLGYQIILNQYYHGSKDLQESDDI